MTHALPVNRASFPHARRGGSSSTLPGGHWLIGAMLLWLLTTAASAEPLPVRELPIAGQTLTVEIAATPETMARGLMFREHLPDDQGMLFVWPRDQVVGMWMQNTLIPLSVAFIDRDYRVRNIAHMEPLSRRVHESDGPVRYALEVNRGWFERHGIEPGTRIDAMPELLSSLGVSAD